MKKMKFILLFLAIFSSSLYAGVNLTDGLVAHYEFEGNAKDSSGNGNDGTEHGGVSYTNGVIGKAGSFDGVDDYLNLSKADYTVENQDNFSTGEIVKIIGIRNENKKTGTATEVVFSNVLVHH